MSQNEPLIAQSDLKIQEAKPELKTNRKKAILFTSITSILIFTIMVCTKAIYATNVKVLDLAFVRALVGFIHAFGVLKCNG
jgi:hypothetical protein